MTEQQESAKSIQLDNNWSIDRDTYTWILRYQSDEKWSEKLQKMVRSTDQTYHGNLQQALTAYADKSLKVCDTAAEILAKLNEVQETIKRVCL